MCFYAHIYKGDIMNNKDWSNIFQAFGLLAQLGIVMVANIGVGFFIGHFIDQLIANSVIFKVIGLLLGIFSGFYSDYRLIKGIIANNNSKSE